MPAFPFNKITIVISQSPLNGDYVAYGELEYRGMEFKIWPPIIVISRGDVWRLDPDTIKAATRVAVMAALTQLLDRA